MGWGRMDEREELSELSGRVISVIYANEENGYTVLRLDTLDGGVTTVVGTLPSACAGEELHAFGEWMTHPSHGRQFKAEYAERSLPRTTEAIYAYLAGRAVKGIGPATATLIVDRFGEQTLDVLENQPEKLTEIRGISQEKAQRISADFRRQAGLRRLMEFLCGHGLRPLLAVRLYRFYGEGAMEVLGGDPYILAAPHIGGSFSEADHLAFDLGCESDDPNRVRAAVIFELRHNANNGHCFIPADKLTAATAQFINAEPENVAAAIEILEERGAITRSPLAGRDACYLSELYEAETFVAERLRKLAKAPEPEDERTRKLVERMEAMGGIVYAPLQREALSLAARCKVMALTGGPGTGKTTSLRGILNMYDSLGIETLLTAPTGRAAKRMSELTGREAQTIHRLLGASFSEEGEETVFARDEDEPLDCGAVVLDGCSMVDITLMRALLAAMPPDCRLILVGDADQLPSVGPGRVFSDVLRSGAIPAVRLTEIFRQAEDSRIVKYAHMINRGEHPELRENAGDFFLLNRRDEARASDTIVELCAERLPKRMGISPEEIQVLTPTRKGELGSAALNRRLQAALNPAAKGKNEKNFGEVTFREGDRVMQIRNNYDIIWHRSQGGGAKGETGSGIYNGDIGYILGIDAENETLTVDFDGRIAALGFEQLMQLEHAWAMTVHKSQGSEYRAVVLALAQAAPRLLTRGVLYTAVTRAKELLIAVGDGETAHRMIDNHVQSRRYSGLRLRLCSEK